MGEIYVQQIATMVAKGTTIVEIADWLDISMPQIRKIILKNGIQPSNLDPESKNFIDSMKLKGLLESSYFMTDLAKNAGISTTRTKMLCKMYGLKPCKKAYCIVCGKEIDLSKSRVVSKFCSRRCSSSHHRPKKTTPIVKKCIYCGKEFEGKSNSKYCSNDCKKINNAIRGAIKCLKNL